MCIADASSHGCWLAGRYCDHNPNTGFASCEVPQELSDREIDQEMDSDEVCAKFCGGSGHGGGTMPSAVQMCFTRWRPRCIFATLMHSFSYPSMLILEIVPTATMSCFFNLTGGGAGQ